MELPARPKVKPTVVDDDVDYAKNLEAWPIFGKPDREPAPKKDETPEKKDDGEMKVSDLNIRLVGTVVSDVRPEMSHAIVEIDNELASVILGSRLGTSKARVIEIRKRYVLVEESDGKTTFIGLEGTSLSGPQSLEKRVFNAINPSRIGRPGAIQASYYNDSAFRALVTKRSVPSIHVNSYGSPFPGVRADHFSIRFEGYLYFTTGGKITLCTENDDGVRVFLHGTTVIEDWRVHTKKKNCVQINVQKGWHPLRVDFFDRTGPAWLSMSTGPSEHAQYMILPSRLCCR